MSHTRTTPQTPRASRFWLIVSRASAVANIVRMIATLPRLWDGIVDLLPTE